MRVGANAQQRHIDFRGCETPEDRAFPIQALSSQEGELGISDTAPPPGGPDLGSIEPFHGALPSQSQFYPIPQAHGLELCLWS